MQTGRHKRKELQYSVVNSHLCYTDGSLFGDFESGAGFAIFQNKVSKRLGYDGRIEMQITETALYDTYRSYYLQSTPICQAEVWAIGKACDFILDNFERLKIKNLAFMVDSQGSLAKLFAKQIILSKLENQLNLDILRLTLVTIWTPIRT